MNADEDKLMIKSDFNLRLWSFICGWISVSDLCVLCVSVVNIDCSFLWLSFHGAGSHALDETALH